MPDALQFGAAGRVTPGWEIFAQATTREINLDDYYLPYEKQQAFHASSARYNLLGGAAGPGKSLALIMEHLMACNEFEDPLQAKQVHTLLLRRTHPQLLGSLIPRFREKVPRELYRTFNEQQKVVTWLNGATTTFGSMQYEKDVWNYQGGQHYRIGFDELTQFTLYQWTQIQAWCRCPVSPWSRQDGATNPIGIGAQFCACLWGCDGKGQRPAPGMDENQRAKYDPSRYRYFPCTYLDNPIYAHDPQFIATLDALPARYREALMKGLWGAALGTYFDIWDDAVNVYDDMKIQPEAWCPRWIGGDWGFEHDAAIYWFYTDPQGVCRCYRELVVNHRSPEQLGELIADASIDGEGHREKIEAFWFSWDAFAEHAGKSSEAYTIAHRMGAPLRKAGLPEPTRATTDKLGREQLMYEMLRCDQVGGKQFGVKVGEYYDDERGATVPVYVPEFQIAASCQKLLSVIPLAPRDEKKPEEIAKFDGDDPLDGALYGLYGKYGQRAEPLASAVAKRMTSPDPTIRHLQALKAVEDLKKERAPVVVRSRRWRPQFH